jgi:hypothetical protein
MSFVGCEIEHVLKVTENKVFGKIFGPKRDEVRDELRM